MQTVFFCSGATFTTGDAITSALLRYALALARMRRFDIVGIPTIETTGRVGLSTLLIGPESQISATALPDDHGDFEDQEVVARLDGATAALTETPMPVGL